MTVLRRTIHRLRHFQWPLSRPADSTVNKNDVINVPSYSGPSQMLVTYRRWAAAGAASSSAGRPAAVWSGPGPAGPAGARREARRGCRSICTRRASPPPSRPSTSPPPPPRAVPTPPHTRLSCEHAYKSHRHRIKKKKIIIIIIIIIISGVVVSRVHVM